MYFVTPTKQLCGLNNNLIAEVFNAPTDRRITIDICNNEKILASKFFDGEQNFKISLKDVIAPFVKINPNSKFVEVDKSRAFKINLESEDTTSNDILICASINDMQPWKLISLKEPFQTLFILEDIHEIAVYSDNTSSTFSADMSIDFNSTNGVQSLTIHLTTEMVGQGVLGAIVGGPELLKTLKTNNINPEDCLKGRIVAKQILSDNSENIMLDFSFECKTNRSINSTRIYWLNPDGGFNFYCFPTKKRTVTTLDKEKLYTSKGGRINSANVTKRTNVRSYALDPVEFEKLAQAITATRIWKIDDDWNFIPIVIEENVCEQLVNQKQFIDITIIEEHEEFFLI